MVPEEQKRSLSAVRWPSDIIASAIQSGRAGPGMPLLVAAGVPPAPPFVTAARRSPAAAARQRLALMIAHPLCGELLLLCRRRAPPRQSFGRSACATSRKTRSSNRASGSSHALAGSRPVPGSRGGGGGEPSARARRFLRYHSAARVLYFSRMGASSQIPCSRRKSWNRRLPPSSIMRRCNGFQASREVDWTKLTPTPRLLCTPEASILRYIPWETEAHPGSVVPQSQQTRFAWSSCCLLKNSSGPSSDEAAI